MILLKIGPFFPFYLNYDTKITIEFVGLRQVLMC